MCLEGADRHCLTLKEPWKLQASSSSGRPRIGPGSVSRELRLGRDEGRSPHDEPRTLVVCGLWRRVHRRERRRLRGAATKRAPEKGLGQEGLGRAAPLNLLARRTSNCKTNPILSREELAT